MCSILDRCPGWCDIDSCDIFRTNTCPSIPLVIYCFVSLNILGLIILSEYFLNLIYSVSKQNGTLVNRLIFLSILETRNSRDITHLNGLYICYYMYTVKPNIPLDG